MKVLLKVVHDKLSASFWFLPALMTVAATLLAVAMTALDHSDYGDWIRRGGWMDRLQIENARLIVSTIAGSMITVTSLVFSLTLIALTLASQQLGPRLLSVFMRDRITQVVLGVFVSTFLYSLLILAALSELDDAWSAPVYSVLMALVLAVISIGFLITFIHHLSSSMQADTMIARIGGELNRRVEHLFPPAEDDGPGESGATEPERESRGAGENEIRAAMTGYVQSIDLESLLECACSHDLVLFLRCRAGDFICEGEALASARPAENVTEKARDDLRSGIVLGATRTPAQDLEFAMGAIVEIALRALSPGVNDPYTAVTCIDRLGDALSRVLRRGARVHRLLDGEGRLRVVSLPFTFENVIDMAFNEIRQSAGDNVAITLRLLDTLIRLGRVAQRPGPRAAIKRHAEMIERSTERFIDEPEDLDDVAERLATLHEILGEPGR